jgi:hypothetical protein
VTMDGTSGTPGRTTGKGRRVLAGVAFVLACLLILVSTVAVWARQVAFNTDRFTALTASVMAQPEVLDPLSARISQQVIDALDVQTRLAAKLPGPTQALAPVLTRSIQDAIDKRLQVVLADPRIQGALVNMISFTHAGVMHLLRDEPGAISVVDGYVQFEVFPVVGAALAELQANGLILAGVQLPDLSTPDDPGVIRQRLAAALGITLPADFGTIRLMPADRLLAARSAVKAFDTIVVALLVLTAVLVLLAVWLARHRRRMVVYLGIGTIIAFLLGRLAIHGIENVLISGITDPDLGNGVRTIFDATLADLRRLTSIVLVVTGVVAIVAYLLGRPQWLVDATAPRGESGGGLSGVIRRNRSAIQWGGLAIIAFLVAWIAVGLDIALLGAALVIGYLLIMRAISAPSEDPTASGDPMASAGGGPPTPGI